METKIINLANAHRKTVFITVGETDYGFMVQDADNQQNIEKFLKGLTLIEKMEGKRGEFLNYFITRMAHPISKLFGEETSRVFIDETYCNFIAFVCDIANHNEVRNWNGIYDKSFPKYVSNLCWNYYIDDDFETFKKGGKPKFNHYSRVVR